jgi:hypothetical protein
MELWIPYRKVLHFQFLSLPDFSYDICKDPQIFFPLGMVSQNHSGVLAKLVLSIAKELMKSFTEFTLSPRSRPFVSLRVTKGE